MIVWLYFEFMLIGARYVNCGRMNMLYWLGVGGCCRKTVARPDNLAKASQSRLCETNRDSPKAF